MSVKKPECPHARQMTGLNRKKLTRVGAKKANCYNI